MNIVLRGRASRVLLAAAVASTVALSACGGSDSDSSASSSGESSSSSGGDEECVANANKFLEDGGWNGSPDGLPESPPARYTALSEPPSAGKKVAFISQTLPDAITSSKAAKEAAEALDWDLKVYTYDSTIPDLQAKVDTALAEKPDFLVSAGVPAAAYQAQIEKAKAQGTAVIINNTLETPTDTTGFAAVTGGEATYTVLGTVLANKTMADSMCTAKVAMFDLDYPILKFGDDLFKKTLNDNCDECEADVTLIQAKDVATPAMTAAMVSKLQSDPDIKYVYLGVGSLATGLSQALKTAGIDDIKIFGSTPDAASFKALRDGTNAWWINMNPITQGYDSIDAAVRLLDTGKPVTDAGGYPLALVTPDNVPEDGDLPVIPDNLLELYKSSWGLK